MRERHKEALEKCQRDAQLLWRWDNVYDLAEGITYEVFGAFEAGWGKRAAHCAILHWKTAEGDIKKAMYALAPGELPKIFQIQKEKRIPTLTRQGTTLIIA